MRYGSSIVCACLVLGTGCGFDATGAGDSPEAADDTGGDGDGDPGDGDPGDGDGDSGDGDGDPGDGDGDTGDGDGDTGDGDGDTGDGDGDTGDGDGDTGDGDGDPDPCAGFTYQTLMLASHGETELPMDIYGDPNQNPGVFAQSQEEGAGTITWTFELVCPAEVVIWGLVWDSKPGIEGNDPDSFWVRVDGEDPEHKWVYGCHTENIQSNWSYQPVSHNQGTDFCMVEDLSWNLAAGMHTLRFRNREFSATAVDAAAVGRVLVTTDMNYVPTLQND
ncbi:hypothetical protein [Enhygromyxa salina]|nr:hypothetical protein [Enhygromyxa salina]